MKFTKTLWILYMILNLSTIICKAIVDKHELHCHIPDKNKRVCEADGWTYYLPEYLHHLGGVKEIRVTSNISSNIIKNYALSGEFSSLITLIIDSPVKQISIEPYAFANLANLENIEINSAIVSITNDTFNKVAKLKSIKLQISDFTRKNLIPLLRNNRNLINLELLNYYSVDICDYQANNPLQLSKLHYTGGHLETLSKGCFKCAKFLEHLIITKTNLTTLKAGSFEALENILAISIVSNKRLTHIPPHVFNIKTLEIIDISDNSIKTIHKRAFNFINNKKLLSLNISYNKIEYIGWKMFENIKCNMIDLSQNNIQVIHNNAFHNSQIDRILLFNNSILNIGNYSLWGLDNKTIVTFYSQHDSIISYPKESQNSSSSENCYLSELSYFKSCKPRSDFTSLSWVMSMVPDQWQPRSLKIEDNEISLIRDQTFVNVKIKSLIITSTAKKFTISEKSFDGLTELKLLVLKTVPIKFNTFFLNNVRSLKALEISATDAESNNIYLCELIWHSNLENILISKAERMAICDKDVCSDHNTKVLSVHYTLGSFTSLEQDDFICLKKLNYLTITNSSLENIKSGSFNGLDKLTVLILSSNKLTLINRNIFVNLTSLNSLILSNNKIKSITDGAFRNQTLSVLDLSYNKLTFISQDLFINVKIKQLDLSHNELLIIESGALKNLDFHTLYIYKNDELNGNVSIWEVDESQIQPNCFEREYYKICTKLNSLSSVTISIGKFMLSGFVPDYIFESSRLELFDISSIQKNAFEYPNPDVYFFKTLAIYYTGINKFTVFPESFVGLLHLENLILNVGPIILKENLFVYLKSLKYLKIEVIETNYYLSQVLTDLQNLKTIEIVGNNSVGICQNIYSKNIPISLTDIRYTTGAIDKLEENSLICVKQIEVFTITKTQLQTIEAGAFNLLDKLRYIDLSFNKITSIAMDVFNSLKNLAVLLINNNEIEDIDNEAFMLFDNKNYILYNLSHNDLATINKDTFDGIKSGQLDLSHNNIRSIEAGAFTDTDIQDLYLINNTNINKTERSWNLSPSTNIFIRESELLEPIYCLSRLESEPEKTILCDACISLCIPVRYVYPPRLG